MRTGTNNGGRRRHRYIILCRVSKLVGSSSGNPQSPGTTIADPLMGKNISASAPAIGQPPQENLSRTHSLFGSLAKGMKSQKQESAENIDVLLAEAGEPKKKSLFQSTAKKASHQTDGQKIFLPFYTSSTHCRRTAVLHWPI